MKTIRGLPLHLPERRAMRKKPTRAEKLLWIHLRDRRLHGYKFRRQHPIGPYIVDYFCHEARLVVEVDGSIHLLPHVQMRDRKRTRFIQTLGNHIIRFTNNEVRNNTANVLDEIEKTLRKLTERSSHPDIAPPPDKGGGQGEDQVT